MDTHSKLEQAGKSPIISADVLDPERCCRSSISNLMLRPLSCKEFSALNSLQHSGPDCLLSILKLLIKRIHWVFTIHFVIFSDLREGRPPSTTIDNPHRTPYWLRSWHLFSSNSVEEYLQSCTCSHSSETPPLRPW